VRGICSCSAVPAHNLADGGTPECRRELSAVRKIVEGLAPSAAAEPDLYQAEPHARGTRPKGQELSSLHVRQTLTVVRTISTEHLAWRATNSATLPSKKRWMPLCPCEPTTIRSAHHSAAESMIVSLMSPTSTVVSTLNPALRRSFAIRSTSSRAGFF